MRLSSKSKFQLDSAGSELLAAPLWLSSRSRHNYWQAEFIGVSSISATRSHLSQTVWSSTALGTSGPVLSKQNTLINRGHLHFIIMSACKYWDAEWCVLSFQLRPLYNFVRKKWRLLTRSKDFSTTTFKQHAIPENGREDSAIIARGKSFFRGMSIWSKFHWGIHTYTHQPLY